MLATEVDATNLAASATQAGDARAPAPRAMMHLSGRSDREGLTRAGIHLGLLVATGTLVALAQGWWLLPAIVLFGIVQASLFAPLHETVHQTAFATRRLNAIVGWISGVPGLWNWHMYQQFHMDHHKYTQIPGKDPELGPPDPETPVGYVLRLLSLTYWQGRLEHHWAALRGDLSMYPYVHPAAAPRVIASMRVQQALLLAGCVASALLWGWQTPFLFWILPQLAGQLVLRFYLITEHTGCSLDKNGLTNTRTVLTNPVVRLLMWNMPYHAEHHLYPFIPFHRLADAHALLRDRLAFVQDGYAAWHVDHVRKLREGGA